MMKVSFVDDTESPTKGQEIVTSATIIEVPPLVVYGVRLYKNGNSIGDIFVSDEKLLKLAGIGKKPAAKILDEAGADDARLLVFASPGKTGFGKKHVEKMEIGCGGKEAKDSIAHCKSLLGKELKASSVLKNGEYVDIISVTTGKGWQGAVKRFGISVQRRKATGKRRHVGTLGQWHPAYVLYTVPQAGQTGYHQRTELNKRIIRISDKLDEINPSSGFPHYGFVKNDYLLLKGSVPGPVKRLVKLRLSVRPPSAGKEVQASLLR
jgi:large subunit ribosomal protein L3